MTDRTLPDLLARQARDQPDAEALRVGDRAHSYRDLWEASGRAAAVLGRRGVGAGDRVVVAVPNGAPFFHAFYGALRVGAAAVPAFPSADPGGLLQLAALSGARHAVVAEEDHAGWVDAAAAQGVTLLPASPADVLGEDVGAPSLDGPGPDDLAVVQYTSGSTGDPRGVRLTHRHLLTNVGQMVAGMGITADDVFVSWLPVYHDMGLILMTMAPLHVGARLVLLPPTLRSVAPWLRAIDEHGGTFTAAPDTAYALCARAVRDPGTYDLSSLRVALNAAEPVRPGTIRAFEQAFGLGPVVVAGYGLAEATVGVSMWPPGMPPKVDAEGRVSVGRPFPEVEVAVVGAGGPLPAGAIGEIAVRSPALTLGYLGNPAADAALWAPDGALLTGDLGYRDADGDLFVVGRTKAVIVQAGRTLYPADVEGVVDAVPGVRRAAAAGVTHPRTGGEHLVVFVEARRHVEPAPGAWRDLAAAVVRGVHGRFGLRPLRVYVLRPRSLPLTPNGKLRHAALRAMHGEGELRDRGLVLFPDY